MKAAVRCAIYTRKSSEEGLDQAFNSLHAQRDACEAYVKSQASEGWRLLPGHYDDGGFSGGNLERPALERLLADVDAGLIDTIVVYKIDRLTRSLGDFAKIVDRLDAARASFVSVTQAFNTTTSMGRLTLNVLLSFAQFEREVTGERIRDKIAASKAKGMWMGGTPPLGYDPPRDQVHRSLTINETEAAQVRLIFLRYLELGSVAELVLWLNREGHRSKLWVTAAGREMGGMAFSRGALFHLLRNRLYLGEVVHKDKSYPGSHPAIIDEGLFARVQVQLEHNKVERRERSVRSGRAPLKGKIFDLDGHPMSPTTSVGRGGRPYRYYVSSPLQQGTRPMAGDEALRRIAAEPFEHHLSCQVGQLIQPDSQATECIWRRIRRVDLREGKLDVTLETSGLSRGQLAGLPQPDQAGTTRVSLPLLYHRRGGRTEINLAKGGHRSRKDPTLIRALADGHRIARALGWRAGDGRFDILDAGAPNHTYARRQCRLAFLAPDIQQAILEGRQPWTMTLDQLLTETLPLDWIEQRKVLGFQ